jgi:hypothetical protein
MLKARDMDRSLFALVLAPLALAGCYSSHLREVDAGPMADAATCDPAARPRCTHRSSPCDTMELVDAECAGVTWQCPAGATLYASPWTDDHCLPLRGVPLFADGVHESPVPVPIGESCEWVFPFSDASGSVQLLGVAAASSCGSLGAPTEPIDAPHDPGTYVNVQSAIATPSGTRVLSRAWAFDTSSYYGVRALGVELGRVDGDHLAFDGSFVTFGDGADLGDAAIVDGDFVYAYGHAPGATGLEADMIVGRAAIASIDDPAAWSILGSGGWGVGDPVPVFGAGPHRSAVLRDPRGGGGFLHVYAAGFGSEIRLHTAPRPEGPWTASVLLVPCELPADDPGAYCAGPQVHRELIDPLDPGAIVVSYSIGSTSADQDERRARDPDAYWPRLVRVRLP